MKGGGKGEKKLSWQRATRWRDLKIIPRRGFLFAKTICARRCWNVSEWNWARDNCFEQSRERSGRVAMATRRAPDRWVISGGVGGLPLIGIWSWGYQGRPQSWQRTRTRAAGCRPFTRLLLLLVCVAVPTILLAEPYPNRWFHFCNLSLAEPQKWPSHWTSIRISC